MKYYKLEKIENISRNVTVKNVTNVKSKSYKNAGLLIASKLLQGKVKPIDIQFIISNDEHRYRLRVKRSKHQFHNYHYLHKFIPLKERKGLKGNK